MKALSARVIEAFKVISLQETDIVTYRVAVRSGIDVLEIEKSPTRN